MGMEEVQTEEKEGGQLEGKTEGEAPEGKSEEKGMDEDRGASVGAGGKTETGAEGVKQKKGKGEQKETRNRRQYTKEGIGGERDVEPVSRKGKKREGCERE